MELSRSSQTDEFVCCGCRQPAAKPSPAAAAPKPSAGPADAVQVCVQLRQPYPGAAVTRCGILRSTHEKCDRIALASAALLYVLHDGCNLAEQLRVVLTHKSAWRIPSWVAALLSAFQLQECANDQDPAVMWAPQCPDSQDPKYCDINRSTLKPAGVRQQPGPGDQVGDARHHAAGNRVLRRLRWLAVPARHQPRPGKISSQLLLFFGFSSCCDSFCQHHFQHVQPGTVSTSCSPQ